MANAWSRALGSLLVAAAVSGTALACSERDAATNADVRRNDSPPTAAASQRAAGPVDQPPPSSSAALRDAAPAAPSEAASGGGSEFHLDGADIEYEAGRRDARPHKGRAIELVLRSTPSGAIAAVDGVAVGPTPALWQGSTDGRAREFTFVLPGYAIARYRFIPMQSGVVHGTLGRLKAESDAGPVDTDTN
jgi:pyruvate/2-oxoglutarate dehydrogenase complex dihydrolipoamide acyltransferase (E2) component